MAKSSPLNHPIRSFADPPWDQFSLTLSHRPEMETLLAMLEAPGSIAEVSGASGTGKTTLLRLTADAFKARHGGVVASIHGWSGLEAADVLETIAHQLSAAEGHSLLIIDDADYLAAHRTMEIINRLETGPWTISTLIGSRRGLGIGRGVSLVPLPREAVDDLIRERLGRPLSEDELEQFTRLSRGVPAAALVILNTLARGAHWEEIEGLFQPFSTPALLGPDGQRLDGRTRPGRRLYNDVRILNSQLLDRLTAKPDAVRELTPRQFEELSADLLERLGYEVELTAATRDGGKDLLAVRKDELGSFLFYVECKLSTVRADRPSMAPISVELLP